ncbi:MAG: TrbI/VirB10 family protein [Deltaproteobacteria bacterium]|nr:TrbI/VirB10 family protein [Deltaproteobacteria bacterium]
MNDYNQDIKPPERPIRSISKNAVYTVVSVGVAAILLVIWLIPTSPQAQRNNGLNSAQDASHASVMQRFDSLSNMPETYDEVVPEMAPEPKQDAAVTAKRKEARTVVTREVGALANKEEVEKAADAEISFFSTAPNSGNFDQYPEPAYRGSSAGENTMVFNKKEKFLRGNGAQSPGMLQGQASDTVIMQGTYIKAVLLSEFSTELPGPILAQVIENIFDSRTGRNLLIPQGTKVVGEYNSSISNGQNKAQVVWTRLVFPNTSSIDLGRMPGVDRSGSSGYKGKVDRHYGELAVGVLVTSLLSSGVSLSAGSSNPHSPSPQKVISRSLGQEAARVGTKMAEQALDIQPTITIKAGTQISIFSTSDLKLAVYNN